MTPAPTALTVRLDALAAACLVSLAIGLAGEFAWRWLAVLALDVPADLASVENADLVLSAVIPVVGNALGYVATFRRPPRRPVLMFVGPSAVLTCIGVAVLLSQLPPAAGVAEVAVTVVAAVITPVVVVGVLLTRRTVLVPLAGKATPVG